eukprot:2525084-Amphidinium_carterae.2
MLHGKSRSPGTNEIPEFRSPTRRTLEHCLRASQSYDSLGTAVSSDHDCVPVPMDFGALIKAEAKGKGKGKGKYDQQKLQRQNI